MKLCQNIHVTTGYVKDATVTLLKCSVAPFSYAEGRTLVSKQLNCERR